MTRGFTLNAGTWIALIIGCISAVALLVLGILCCKCLAGDTSSSGAYVSKTDLKRALDEISEIRDS
jgi:hypothetical protein